jgi:hypothetical protein
LSSEEKSALVLQAHDALSRFHASRSSALCINKTRTPSASVLFYHLAYHTSILLTHRPLLNSLSGSTSLRLALHSTTSNATSISRLIRAFRKGDNNLATAPPYLINYLLSAAIIHVFNATAGRKSRLGRASAHGLSACLEALREMRLLWKHRTSVAIRLIRELAERWKVVWAMPMQFCQPLVPEEMTTAHSTEAPPGLRQDNSIYEFSNLGMDHGWAGWAGPPEVDFNSGADFPLDPTAISWLFNETCTEEAGSNDFVI